MKNNTKCIKGTIMMVCDGEAVTVWRDKGSFFLSLNHRGVQIQFNVDEWDELLDTFNSVFHRRIKKEKRW